MKSKKLFRYISYTLLSLVAICITIFTVEFFTDQARLNKIQEAALAELEENEGKYAENTIVLYDTDEEETNEFASLLGARVRSTPNGEFATLTLPEGLTVEDVYSSDDYKEYLDRFSLDYYGYISEAEVEEESEEPTHTPSRPNTNFTINDQYYSSQSYLDYINLSTTWNNYKGDGVTVAIIDSGIDTDHPEFAGKISSWSYNASYDKIVRDYGDDWSLIEDEQGHGTAVAGVIAASMNNETGIVGIAPNVNLLIIKVECNEKGQFYNSSDLIFGLYYAIEQDVDVVNMSFGGGGDFIAPVRLAVDSDIICVAAAGNDGKSLVSSPAALDEVIGVGALAPNSWELASYSNYGEGLDVVAPGTVYTTKMGGGYQTIQGTSFSAPIVSAAAALYKQQNPYNEYSDFKELLHASSYDLGDLGNDFVYGFGALDVSALLLEARGTVTFNYLTDEIDNTQQVFVKGHALQELPEPERNYAVFDGWFYDVHCEEEVAWYEDIWNQDITLYAKWCNEDDGIPYTYTTLSDNTIEIHSYTGHRRYITMPDNIEGKVVSSIGSGAFSLQTRLRQVTLSKYLVNIKERAFYNCANLVSISIPKTVTYIGDNAFSGNTRLSTIILSNESKLEHIGDNAFAYTRIREFVVPKLVSYLNGTAFLGTTNMQRYYVTKGNTNFVASNGVLYNSTGSKVVSYPAGLSTTYSLPNSVTTIGNSAFAYSKLQTIDFKKVETIEESAFRASSLELINITNTINRIGSYSFSGCEYLREVHIGRGIKTIESDLFSGCISLESITIPNTVENIEGGAFSGSGLEEVLFESNSNLLEIGGSSFSFTNLSSITIPRSVQIIGSEAFLWSTLEEVYFESNSSLKTIGDYAFVANYRLNSVSLPYGLTTIGSYAFEGCYSLTDIVLPDSLEYLGSYAFKDSGLTGDVYLPASLSNVGINPFASCQKLTSISVDADNPTYQSIDGVLYSKEGASYSYDGKTFNPDKYALISYPSGKSDSSYDVISDTSIIEHSAFYGTHYLSEIHLDQELQEIHEKAFYKCDSLNQISIPDNVTQIGRYAFAYTDNLWTVEFGYNAKISRISAYSFAQSGIHNFSVPKNVSSIAQHAFADCDNLTYMYFEENSKLTYISAYNFDGCSNLTNISFGSGSSLKTIEAHAFENMDSLWTINFGGAHITRIGNYAFRFCPNLHSINIPEGVESIGRFAFYGDSSLTQVTIPSSVQYIGRYAFYTRNNIIDVYFKSTTLPEAIQENWDAGIKGYYLDSVQLVDDGDFEYSRSSNNEISIIKYKGNSEVVDLSSLDLGGDIVSIGGYAFSYSGVKTIILPNTLRNISQYAFAYSDFESIEIPNNVTFIGKYAFYHCNNLEEVTFDNPSLTRIEQYAFAYTESLDSIYLPESVQYLGSYVFYKSGISEVIFDENIGIEEIPQSAFEGTKLTSVTIPNSVTLINHNAFRDITTLTSIIWGTENEFWLMNNVFYNTGLSGDLYIPQNLTYIGEYSLVGLNNLDNYVVDGNNEYYQSIDGVLYSKDGSKLICFPANRTGSFVVPNYVETIGFGAFENSKLSEVSFEEGINLLTIGYRAFFNADNLVSIDIPASVVSIDYYAFAYCDNLTTVNFAEDSALSGIYEGAFYLDKSLTNIVLPDSIKEISDFAFYGCQGLTQLPISENSELRGIYDYAFAYSGIDGDLVVPDSVTDLGDYSFEGTSITSAYISTANEVSLSIGLGVFNECHQMEEITIPFTGDSYMSTDIIWLSYIFGAGNNEVSDLYIPESLKAVRVTGDIIPTSIYKICNNWSRFEEVVLPKGITIINGNYFESSTKLRSIVIPNTVTSIDIRAFASCPNLEKVIFESGSHLISIGGGAFRNCPNLSSINIPDGVTSIGEYAFYNCSSLSSVNIPDGVTSISNYSFSECSSLVSITIPNTVTSIGNNAFVGCSFFSVINNSDLEFVIGTSTALSVNTLILVDKNENITYKEGYDNITITEDGFAFSCDDYGYRLVYYLGNEEYVTLPDTINDCSYTIYRLKRVKNVIIPTGWTSIDSQAFNGCRSLTSITIPNAVTSIGSMVFENCYNLQTVIFESGSNLVSIGSRTFRNCPNLSSINIPDGVTSIGEYAFYNCSSLSSVNIPDGITSISNYTFYNCSNLSSIILPNTITSIGVSAFSGCSSLSSIIIPGSVVSVGGSAFSGCSNLSSVIVSYGVIEILNQTFSGCSNLSSIVLPDSVTFIGGSLFSGCSNLTSVILSNSITTIGNYVFYNCENLTTIKIPSAVTYIFQNAFMNCSNLIIEVDENNEYYASIDGVLFNKDFTKIIYVSDVVTELFIPNTVTSFVASKNIETVVFEEGSCITSINENAFSGCSKLTSITLPNTVTSIDYNAFSGCSSLVTITIPNSVISIGGSAFSGCSSLVSITIPNGITSISNYTFSGCSSLVSITIPNTVTSIGEYAFYNCSSLSSVNIPDGITSISNYTFSGCSSLVSITIPNTVTSIGRQAFSHCSNLQTVIFEEDSQTSYLGMFCFEYCFSLTSITIPSSVDSYDVLPFYGCSFISFTNNSDLEFVIGTSGALSVNTLILIDKNGNVTYREDYEGTIIMDDFMFLYDGDSYKLVYYLGEEEYVTLPDTINDCLYAVYKLQGVRNVIIPTGWTSIGNQAFSGSRFLTSVTIPNTVTYIGKGAFEGCSRLETVVFESDSHLEFIDNGAFTVCSSLTSITFPNSLITIGPDVFDHCTSLTSIVIPNSVVAIDNAAFYDCRNIEMVIFEENSHLESIGSSVFKNCYSLSSITLPNSVTSIGDMAFEWCYNLHTLNLPPNIKYLGSNILNGTPLLKDGWTDGVLSIDGYLFKVNNCFNSFVFDYIAAASDAFKDTTLTSIDLVSELKSSYLQNINTLVIHNYETYVLDIFKRNIPISLKTIVLKDCSDKIYIDFLEWVTGVTIYVDDYKDNLMWDHDNPDWNYGNKVYYKGEWIKANFYDENDVLIDTNYRTIYQVIQQPYVSSLIEDEYSRIFVGWDLDGDGIADSVPATSASDINAKAIMKTVKTEYTVNFYGFNNELVSSNVYNFGDLIVAPEVNYKGYIFLGWDNYVEGMIVDSSLDIHSSWVHNGKHNYFVTNVPSTCTEEGYDLHTCDVCDEFYKDNIIPALGHDYGEWIIVFEPTCTEEGTRYHECSVCHEKEYEIIPALGHDYEKEVTLNATCEHEGELTYTCSRCDHVEVETMPLADHHYEKVFITDNLLEELLKNLPNSFYGYEDNIPYIYECDECGYIRTASDIISTKGVRTLDVDCDHVLGDWVIVTNPTCVEDGLVGRYCVLCEGLVVAKTVDKTGIHTPGSKVNENTINPTCTQTGSHDEVVYCNVCHVELERNHIVDSALGHDLIHHDELAPTCTELGWNEYDTCSRCDYTTYDEIPALGHDYQFDSFVWDEYDAEAKYICSHDNSHIEYHDAVVTSEVTTAPTCTETGIRTYTATYDSHKETKEEILPALGHDYQASITLPTCTEQGYTTHTCSRCSDSYIDTYVDALGHSYGEWEVVTNPTCTNKGSEHHVCSVCEHEEVRDIAALGHDLIHHDEVAPTCTEHGNEAYDTCSRCDYTTYIEISAKGHTPVTDEAVAPTCTTTGLTEGSHCSTCNEVLVAQEVVPALGHDYHFDHFDWSEDGKSSQAVYICSHDASHIVKYDAEVTSIVKVAPTCTAKGTTTYTATYLSYHESVDKVDIPALGHTPGSKVNENTINPTCTQTGSHDEVVYCNVCHVELERNHIVDSALGHDLIHHDELAPTCTELGWNEYDTCSRCDYTTYDEIPALGHDYGEWVVTKEATFTETGLKERTCSRCGEKEYEVIAKVDATPYLIETLESINFEEDSTSTLFNKIKEAYELYSYVENKEAISEQYELLVRYMNEYNERVNAINDNQERTNNDVLSIVIVSVVSTINLLVVSLLLTKRWRFEQ